MKVVKTCPECGSHLIIKDGRHGEFLGCPRFPACRHTEPVEDTEQVYIPVKHEPTEHYAPIKPEDMDYPVSWSWHRYYETEAGRPDPGPNIPDRQASGSVSTAQAQNSDTRRPQPRVVPNDQILGLVVSLQNRLNQHIDNSKRRDRL